MSIGSRRRCLIVVSIVLIVSGCIKADDGLESAIGKWEWFLDRAEKEVHLSSAGLEELAGLPSLVKVPEEAENAKQRLKRIFERSMRLLEKQAETASCAHGLTSHVADLMAVRRVLLREPGYEHFILVIRIDQLLSVWLTENAVSDQPCIENLRQVIVRIGREEPDAKAVAQAITDGHSITGEKLEIEAKRIAEQSCKNCLTRLSETAKQSFLRSMEMSAVKRLLGSQEQGTRRLPFPIANIQGLYSERKWAQLVDWLDETQMQLYDSRAVALYSAQRRENGLPLTKDAEELEKVMETEKAWMETDGIGTGNPSRVSVLTLLDVAMQPGGLRAAYLFSEVGK